MGKQKKKKNRWQQYIAMGGSILIGAACGFLIIWYLNSLSVFNGSFIKILLSCMLLLIGMYLALFLQIIIHEAGHLVFGLLTGYRFSSFRVGSFMWVKQNGKLKFKRLSLAGTGGQCLMAPPEMADGKMPFVLYNLGGSFFNLASCLVFFGLALFTKNLPYLPALLVMLCIIGIAYALLNGIPLQTGMVNNDGSNALSLGKNSTALRAFWVQLQVNEQISRGVRLKDMPEEWFAIPAPEDMDNSITAATGVFTCNRLMDLHHFEQADQLMEELLEMDCGMVGLHRNLLLCDRIFCELVGKNRPEQVAAMLDAQQQKFMKSMKNYPTVLRTEYTHALLGEKNAEKAASLMLEFEKCARTYPYPVDIESERELISIADLAAKRQEATGAIAPEIPAT